MALYRIPDRYIEGFDKISKLDDAQANIIFDELNSSKFGLDSSQIAESLLSKPEFKKKLKIQELKAIIKTIYSVLRFDVHDSDRGKMVSDLTQSFLKQAEKPKKDAAERLENNLNIFLKISGRTKQTVKGRRLLQENEKNFSSARIITDVRFVFDDDFEEKDVENAVIIHRMKVDYVKGFEGKESFYAMDTNDLKELKEVIDRALEKEKAIKNGNLTKNLTFLSLD